jgi:hypothetical protein
MNEMAWECSFCILLVSCVMQKVLDRKKGHTTRPWLFFSLSQFSETRDSSDNPWPRKLQGTTILYSDLYNLLSPSLYSIEATTSTL